MDDLLDARRGDFVVTPPETTPAHPIYESIALIHEGELDPDRFADFMEVELARFAGRLFRTKGILSLAGMNERMIVQGVADGVDVDFGAPWGEERRTSRLVIVGFGLDRASLTRAFQACAVGSAVVRGAARDVGR